MQDETFMDHEEKRHFLRRGQVGGIENKAFEIGATNRIVTPPMARKLAVLRAVCLRLNIKKGLDFCDRVEEYELTVGEPENSRSYALRLTRAQYVPPEKGAGESL